MVTKDKPQALPWNERDNPPLGQIVYKSGKPRNPGKLIEVLGKIPFPDGRVNDIFTYVKIKWLDGSESNETSTSLYSLEAFISKEETILNYYKNILTAARNL